MCLIDFQDQHFGEGSAAHKTGEKARKEIRKAKTNEDGER